MAYDIFMSYAHQDKKLRDKLATHLSNLREQGLINDWYDGDIVPGSEWEQQILTRLDSAHIILLLISADFMASKFCAQIELKRAIERHKAGQAWVLPILLRPTDYKGAPFAEILMLPSEAKAVTRWSDKDAAWLDVVEGIKRAIKALNENPS